MTEYLTMAQAARRLGVSMPTLRERVRRGEIVVYSNPVDRRSRLVALADLASFAHPQPLTHVSGGRRMVRT